MAVRAEIVGGDIVGLATLLNWGCVFLIVFFYPVAQKQLGSGPIFLFLGAVTFLLVRFLFYSMVQTKDKT